MNYIAIILIFLGTTAFTGHWVMAPNVAIYKSVISDINPEGVSCFLYVRGDYGWADGEQETYHYAACITRETEYSQNVPQEIMRVWNHLYPYMVDYLKQYKEMGHEIYL